MARAALAVAALGMQSAACLCRAEPATDRSTGPQTERRFPPLVLPEGFSATLFACDPLVAFPSCIARGPRPGTLYVAHDYVKGMGATIERPDELRLLEDTNGDGYADSSRLVATGFNSIQGLEAGDDALYVMHAPFLTLLRDANRDGDFEVRQDLLTGLGLPPEKNPSRLHGANGLISGHDGWLYLALGDNGCSVPLPEGDRLVVEGGGILRCRRDGSDLHLFARGLRNIYDVALDQDLNVFVRDNENDGGDYMIRVIHSFFGADHGYPYLYRDHPHEALPPLADLGRGSSAGVVFYAETQFPAEFRGALFECEWGRAVVWTRPRLQGSGFSQVKEEQFAAGHPSDPYGFKPTDLVVDHDGTLLVSDWGDDQATRRGRGRIYRVRHTGQPSTGPPPATGTPGLEDLIATLDDASLAARCAAQRALERQGDRAVAALLRALESGKLGPAARRHAAWILALGSPAGTQPSRLAWLKRLAAADPEPMVRVQAIRALADLADPVLRDRKLAATGGDPGLAAWLAETWPDQPTFARREIVVALGRWQWPNLPHWLASAYTQEDAALAHAAQQALRQAHNWPAVLALLDQPAKAPLRAVALRALAEQYDLPAVLGLLGRLEAEHRPQPAAEYAVLLARVWKKPPAWSYWGYRPAPRPANTITWELTERIAAAIERALLVIDDAHLGELLYQIEREQLPLGVVALEQRLAAASADDVVLRLLALVARHPAEHSARLLAAHAVNRKQGLPGRTRAVEWLARQEGDEALGGLISLASDLEEGPLLARVLFELGQRKAPGAIPAVAARLASGDPGVRAASARSLSALEAREFGPRISTLLDDASGTVRLAAAQAAGALGVREAAKRLDAMARGDEPPLRAEALRALGRLRDPRALDVAQAALDNPAMEHAATVYLAALADASQAENVCRAASRSPTREALEAAFDALERWAATARQADEARGLLMRAARLQGQHLLAARWRVKGPAAFVQPAEIEEQLGSAENQHGWQTVMAREFTQVRVPRPEANHAGAFVAATLLLPPEETLVHGEIVSRGAIELAANGQPVALRDATGGTRTFELTLATGPTVLVARVPGAEELQFQLTLRRKAGTAEHERLTDAALRQTGNAENGRQLLLDVQKTQCLKCHRLHDRGETIGPDLTAIGGRFSRVHLIESILRPSQSVGPAFRTLSVELEDGRVLSGVPVAGDENSLTLADQKGTKHVIARTAIAGQAYQETSTMPEGLEKALTPAEFVDLVTFLSAQK